MIRKACMIVSLAVGISLAPAAAPGAQGDDPDWPCIQRKVPELSLGQVWTGSELPPEAASWEENASIAGLVAEVTARRLPLPQALERLRAFRDDLAPDQKRQRVAMLVQGLFDKMNRERSHVISGIARYAHRQREMAATLRQEAAAIDAMRAKGDANEADIARRSQALTFQTRIFQERAASLTFVCEVPTLIEQRLYALTNALREDVPGK